MPSTLARPSDKNRRSQGGFTLLEVIIAVGFGAFLAASVYGVIIETLTLSRLTGEGTELDREGRMILDLMIRDLSGLPRFAYDGKIERFSGKTERDLPRLDFVSAADSLTSVSRVASDLTEVGYRLELREDASGLFRLYRREDFFADASPLSGGALSVVSDRVKGLSLEYRGDSHTDVWAETWSDLGSGAAPAAIRVTLVLARPDPDGPDGPGTGDEKTFETILETRTW